MNLSVCSTNSRGTVKSVGGDREAHRRLVDMGLLGGSCRVRSKRKKSLLVDFCDEFSLVVTAEFATQIEVSNAVENSAVRKSERR